MSWQYNKECKENHEPYGSAAECRMAKYKAAKAASGPRDEWVQAKNPAELMKMQRNAAGSGDAWAEQTRGGGRKSRRKSKRRKSKRLKSKRLKSKRRKTRRRRTKRRRSSR